MTTSVMLPTSKVIAETGVLRGRRRRAVDSTILADAVATQDTVTQLVSAIRKVAREVPGAAEQVGGLVTIERVARAGDERFEQLDVVLEDLKQKEQRDGAGDD